MSLTSHSTTAADQLLSRAAGLRPLLEANATRTENDRRVPEENIQALTDEGLFNLLTPTRWGGPGTSVRTYVDVIAELGKSCTSTAWVTALVNVCNWLTSLLPEQAQDDVFGRNPQAKVCGVLAPTGTAVPTDGGYTVNGQWGFASACWHADWALVGTPLFDADGNVVDQAVVFIPMNELAINDVWFVSGMAGTGSNTVIAKDVFVPSHRVLPVPAAIQGLYPSHAGTTEITDRWAFIPVLAIAIVPPPLGAGRAVLEAVAANAGKRGIAYTSYERQTDSTVVHHQIAEAAMKIDGAWMHTLRAADDIDEVAARGTYMEYEQRARVRADCGWAGELVRQGVDRLMSIGGASGFANASVLQRMWRDINVSTRHAVFTTAPNLELYGRALLGVDGNITPLI